MPGTFASELALEGGRWAYTVEVAGWGRLLGGISATRRGPYRLTTHQPSRYGLSGITETYSHLQMLRRPAGTIGESVDLRAGKTLLGEFSFELDDLPIDEPSGEVHGWSLLLPLATQIMADHAPAASWRLAADTTTADPETWTLVSIAGIVVDQLLHVGAEVVHVSALPGGMQVTVNRAQQNTIAAIHRTRTSYPPGDGTIYSRPQYVAGREVRLYANLADTRASGDGSPRLLPVAQQRLLWRGYLDTWEQTSDGGGYMLRCRPALGRLDYAIGLDQYRARVAIGEGTNRDGATMLEAAQQGKPAALTLDPPVGEGNVRAPDYPSTAGSIYWHARMGEQIIAVESPYAPTAYCLGGWAIRWAQGGTPAVLPAQWPVDIWDVLLTDPQGILTLAGATVSYLVDRVDGVSNLVHPLQVMRAMVRSDGTFPVGSDRYNCLPANWGAAVPDSQLNLATWDNVLNRTTQLRIPSLVIGRDGKPFSLRQWAERTLIGPWGMFLFPDHNGLIALGQICELYPGDTWPSVSLVAGSARLVGTTDQTLYQQSYEYAHTLDGKAARVLRYLHPQARERMVLAGEESLGETAGNIDLPGLNREPGDGALSLIHGLHQIRARWWVTPLPRVRFSVGLDDLELDLTRGLLLTSPETPDPFTGLRGMVDRPAVVVSRAINCDTNAIDLEAVLMPRNRLGLWAPAGTLTGAAAGGGVQFALAANDHTQPGGGPDSAPERDAKGFTVGDRVQISDSRGDRLCDVARTVTFVEPGGVPNRVDIDAQFTLAGVPVVTAAGQVLRFCHWSTGAAPQAVWTTTMQWHVAQADSAGLLPDGDDAYLYGGV